MTDQELFDGRCLHCGRGIARSFGTKDGEPIIWLSEPIPANPPAETPWYCGYLCKVKHEALTADARRAYAAPTPKETA